MTDRIRSAHSSDMGGMPALSNFEPKRVLC